MLQVTNLTRYNSLSPWARGDKNELFILIIDNNIRIINMNL